MRRRIAYSFVRIQPLSAPPIDTLAVASPVMTGPSLAARLVLRRPEPQRRPSPPFVAEFHAIAVTFAPPNGGRSSWRRSARRLTRWPPARLTCTFSQPVGRARLSPSTYSTRPSADILMRAPAPDESGSGR
jgi:hypothetical protein